MVRPLASHQCSPGLIPSRCYTWVEFVVGSRLAPRVFLRVVQFSSLHKNQNPQVPIRIEDLYENQLRLMWLPYNKDMAKGGGGGLRKYDDVRSCDHGTNMKP